MHLNLFHLVAHSVCSVHFSTVQASVCYFLCNIVNHHLPCQIQGQATNILQQGGTVTPLHILHYQTQVFLKWDRKWSICIFYTFLISLFVHRNMPRGSLGDATGDEKKLERNGNVNNIQLALIFIFFHYSALCSKICHDLAPLTGHMLLCCLKIWSLLLTLVSKLQYVLMTRETRLTSAVHADIQPTLISGK